MLCSLYKLPSLRSVKSCSWSGKSQGQIREFFLILMCGIPVQGIFLYSFLISFSYHNNDNDHKGNDNDDNNATNNNNLLMVFLYCTIALLLSHQLRN